MAHLSLSELEWHRPASIIYIGYYCLKIRNIEELKKWLKDVYIKERHHNESIARLSLFLLYNEDKIKKIIKKIEIGMKPKRSTFKNIKQTLTLVYDEVKYCDLKY